MSKKSIIHIGTSGWSYDHWKGTFYPKEIKSDQRLHFYGQHFSTIEVNSTFYHLPKEETITNWGHQVPKKFIFSIKASQYITHLTRLGDPSKTLPLFFERLHFLENKIGIILFQLPPSFKKNIERLSEFITFLDKNFRYTFEFRHISWFDEETYALLKQHNMALCITDWGGELSPEIITADFTYIRLHGPQKTYQGFYGPKRLQQWKTKIFSWADKKISAFCYFDNDDKGYAIKDALKLKELIESS